jgi:hypothetical protein
MITITEHTTKKDLLNQLARVANEEGTLFVNLESRPNFLATPISFTIFNYQISNYPRKLVWNSDRPAIRNFLRDCHVEYVDHQATYANYQNNNVEEEDTFEDTVIQEVNTAHDPVEPAYQAETQAVEEPEAQVSYQQTQPKTNEETIAAFAEPPARSYHTFIDVGDQYHTPVEEQTPAAPSQQPAIEASKTSLKQSTPSSISHPEFNPQLSEQSSNTTHSLVAQPSQDTQHVFSAEELLKKGSYQPSTLLDKVRSDVPAPVAPIEAEVQAEYSPLTPNQFSVGAPQGPNQQNLDHWLERIESTRKALNSVRFQPTPQRSPLVSFMRFSTVSAALSVIVSGIILFFPTNVYSLEVASLEAQDELPIQIDLEEMGLQESRIDSSVSATPTGEERTQLSRARGSVVIVNTSGNTVSFDKSGIILRASNGQEYRHIPKNSEPNTFRVPARSNINGGNVTIEIEALNEGAGGELGQGEVLSMYNLNRDLLGRAITAQVPNEISTNAATGNFFVTEEDQDDLRAKANQQIGSLINQKISEAAENERLITDPTWFTTGENSYNFSHNVQEVASELTLDTTTPVTVYNLAQETLEAKIKERNLEVDSITAVTEIIKEGDFDLTSGVELQVQYTYIKKNSINQEEVARILSSGDFEAAREEVKEEFPEIQDIQVQSAGIDLPGVPQKVNLEFLEQDQ